VPVGTPKPLFEKFASAIKEIMALPAAQERYRAASSTGGSLTLDDWQRFVREDAQAWRPLVLQSGATVD
jgi:tripartite-type tricarboxylate transporter receptor subunit TctC